MYLHFSHARPFPCTLILYHMHVCFPIKIMYLHPSHARPFPCALSYVETSVSSSPLDQYGNVLSSPVCSSSIQLKRDAYQTPSSSKLCLDLSHPPEYIALTRRCLI